MRDIEVIQKTGIIQLNDRNFYRIVTKAEFNQKLLSTDEIQLSVESKSPINFYLGDVICHQGRYFTLNIAPTVKRENGYYNYDLIFEGIQYSLRKKIYFNLDKTGVQTTAEFPLTGEIDMFLKVLVNNINSLNEGEWVLGEYPENTETKTLTFNNDNCLSVLQKICEEYQTEFEFIEDIKLKKYQLNIKKIGRVLNDTFEYGYGNGLYSLNRTNENNDVVTKLYVFGASENIPHDYRKYSDRLRMPISQGDFIMDENKVKIFGLKEGVKILDIKPMFRGIISRVGNFDKKTKTQELQVNNMDFDLNEVDNKGNTKYLISETPVKLNFLKGNLAGYSFELIKKEGYNHKTKIFKVRQFVDDRGQAFPDMDTIFQFKVGDEFTLTDIVMPETYINRAEGQLLEKGRKEYEKISINNTKYTLTIDPFYLKGRGNDSTVFFRIGDYVKIIDTSLGIDKSSRIIGLNQNLLEPFEYKIEIADTYEINFTASVISEIKDTKTIIKTQKQENRQNLINGFLNIKELRENIFDTDGYFDAGRIKPESIDTNMLNVGAKSQSLTLEDVTLDANVNGSSNHLKITSGRLVHLNISNTPKVWNMREFIKSNLKSILYYVYAKVSRTGNDGSWEVTTEKIRFDERDNFYYFLCFVLYTPIKGKRNVEAMYGSVHIHGGQITAGRIESINKRTYIDLDTGDISGKISFHENSPALKHIERKIGEDTRIKKLINKTNFLTETAINGNSIATGNVIVGNNYGANAGLTGLGGNSDLFLWGGADFEHRDKPPLGFYRDGFIRVRNGNGQVIFEIGQKDGKAVFNIYNDSGIKIAEIGQGGMQFIGYIPDSWSEVNLVKLDSQGRLEAIEEAKKSIKRKIFRVISGDRIASLLDKVEYQYYTSYNQLAYNYHAGNNFETYSNNQYESIYFKTKNKLGQRVQNGYYFLGFNGYEITERGEPTKIRCKGDIILIDNGKERERIKIDEPL